MKFVDELVIEVESGKGGDGMIAFRREKYVPFGGPSGGDGGRGGDIVLRATRDINTLYELSFQRIYKAQPGRNGMSKNMEGAAGKDCEIKVPVGTIIFNAETGENLANLDTDGTVFIVARGGRGGKGNARFASSVRRAPRVAEKGEPSEKFKLKLELKLLADVGLVGLPNSGKSTFLRAISNARPKVADYPFTTLTPNLGIVKPEGMPSFCVADLPGLIEGAHEGAGLGLQFLKHIERTKLLLHLVDLSEVSEKELLRPFNVIMNELETFDRSLIEKPMIVLANKMDLPQSREKWEKFSRRVKKLGFTVLQVSGATKEGTDEVLETVSAELTKIQASIAPVREPEKLYSYLPPFEIEKIEEGFWRVNGTDIEKLVKMTDFTNEESVVLFKKNLKKAGFLDELSNCSAKDEDIVTIGEMEFAFREFFH